MHRRWLWTVRTVLGLVVVGFALRSTSIWAATPAAVGHTNRFDREIDAFIEADRRSPPVAGAVVFYGSSSFRLWTNLTAAFPEHRVVNRGFGGSQLSDLNWFFERVIPPQAPKLLLIYGGDNDIASGKSAAQVEADFRTLVGLTRRFCPDTRIVFVAIKPSPSRLTYLAQQLDANSRVRRFARWHRHVDYLDTASPVLDSEGRPDPRFFLADRLHLNTDGYRAWQAVIGPYLDRYDR